MSGTLNVCKIKNAIAHLPFKLPQGWVIFGSSALVLNGVEGVETSDIDILVPCAETQVPTTFPVPGASIFHSERRLRQDLEGVLVDVSWGLLVWDGKEWCKVEVEKPVERDGLRYASLQDCMRLMRQFNRPKDSQRLSLLCSVKKKPDSKGGD